MIAELLCSVWRFHFDEQKKKTSTTVIDSIGNETELAR